MVSAPYELTVQARQALVLSTLKRVCAAGADGANAALWAPLLSRLISRGLEDPDTSADQRREASENLRQHLLSFVTANLQARCGPFHLSAGLSYRLTQSWLSSSTELARLWLNEEWFASRCAGIQTVSHLSNKDDERWVLTTLLLTGPTLRPPPSRLPRTLQSNFVRQRQATPSIPYGLTRDPSGGNLPPRGDGHEYRTVSDNSGTDRVQSSLPRRSLLPDRMQLGFSTLRELVVMRPSVRSAALDVLLGLCTHAGTTTQQLSLRSFPLTPAYVHRQAIPQRRHHYGEKMGARGSGPQPRNTELCAVVARSDQRSRRVDEARW